MGDKTHIQWTDATWNPLRGCSRVSEGCRFCYAEAQAQRFSGVGQAYDGLVARGRWTGEIRFIEEALDLPLRWKRPRRIFVNSMSDLFHEKVPDEWIDQIFTVMARATKHTFQVLTKRPARMLKYLQGAENRILLRMDLSDSLEKFGYQARPNWPLPNVWLGVSVEDQATADERIPLLLQTPTAVRWVSYEPALEEVQFSYGLHPRRSDSAINIMIPRLDWLVVGGESGPSARPFDLAWARNAIAQGRAAGVAVFVKQLGSKPIGFWKQGDHQPYDHWGLKDRKGGDTTEWPEDLRVREYPT